MDRLLKAYDDALGRYAVPFAPLDAPGFWHLTVLVVESFRPETIYDIDCRPDQALVHRTRLYPSLWDAMNKAKEMRGEVAPDEVERACERLALEAGIRRLVDDEAIFRLADGKALGVDGTTVTAIFTCHGCRPLRRSCWQPADLKGTGWPALLGAVGEAVHPLPPSKWY